MICVTHTYTVRETDERLKVTSESRIYEMDRYKSRLICRSAWKELSLNSFSSHTKDSSVYCTVTVLTSTKINYENELKF